MTRDSLIAQHIGTDLVATVRQFIEEESDYNVNRLAQFIEEESDYNVDRVALMAARFAGRFQALLDIGEIHTAIFGEEARVTPPGESDRLARAPAAASACRGHSPEPARSGESDIAVGRWSDED